MISLLSAGLCVAIMVTSTYCVPMSEFYPFGMTVDDKTLPRNSETVVSAPVDFFTLNFYAQTFTSVFVRMNSIS